MITSKIKLFFFAKSSRFYCRSAMLFVDIVLSVFMYIGLLNIFYYVQFLLFHLCNVVIYVVSLALLLFHNLVLWLLIFLLFILDIHKVQSTCRSWKFTEKDSAYYGIVKGLLDFVSLSFLQMSIWFYCWISSSDVIAVWLEFLGSWYFFFHSCT